MNYIVIFSLFIAFILPVTLLTSFIFLLEGMGARKNAKNKTLNFTKRRCKSEARTEAGRDVAA
jgi:hypothetical protein